MQTGKTQIFNGNVAAVAGNDVTIQALYVCGDAPKTTREMVAELMQFHNQSPAHKLALKSYAHNVHGNSYYNNLSDAALADMLAFKDVLSRLLTEQQQLADQQLSEAQETVRQTDQQLSEALEAVRQYRQLAEKRCFLCRVLHK